MAMYSNVVEISKAGPQGPQGLPGVAGPAGGPTGATGPQGESGAFALEFPATPYLGQVWVDLESGKMYVYIEDGDSNQWVQVATAPQGPTGPTGDATAYTLATPADWNTSPTTIAQALDELAARMRAAGN
jgi:hypothetical protein